MSHGSASCLIINCVQPARSYMKIKPLLSFLVLPLLGFFFAIEVSAGQPAHEGSTPRARRAFERALEAYHQYDYERVLQETNTAIARAPQYVNALLLRGEVLYLLQRHNESAETYGRVIEIAGDRIPQAHFYSGMSYLLTGRYEQAKKRLLHFISLDSYSRVLVEEANDALHACDFAIYAMQHPVEFDPVNMGPAINSADAEYSPAVTADGQTLVFTRRINSKLAARGNRVTEVEDFYVSYWLDGVWTEAVNLGPPINTSNNEGAQSLSADGRDLYFTACNRPDGMGSCDLYYSRRTGQAWQPPVNLGPVVNSSSWDSHPSVSSDGKELYFASARGGGYGKMDIWVSTKSEDGQWQAPKNLGPVVNSGGREMSPFIHPDNQTLYFASDGHPGMGGLDIFFSRKDEDGQWTTPVNIGYPINTHNDEFSLVIDAGGHTAWYASDQPGGHGLMDLYTFTLHENARPVAMTYMKGTVYDQESGQTLGASFELIDLETGETIVRSASDPENGEFLVVVPVNTLLALHVSSPGYLFFSDHFHYTETRTTVDPHLEDIYMQPVRTGESVVLRNVFFETGSHHLDPASRAELQRLASMLLENPDIHIRVDGHTDSVGSYEDNLLLSENRAKSVVMFLQEAGVSSSRLTSEGYADTKPVDTNETAEGRANNRRTEFTIVDPAP